jgi:hypothetical protein
MSMSAKKYSLSWQQKLGLLLVSAALCLGLAEGAIRHWFPIRGLIYQLDEQVLHKHIPGSRKMYRHPKADGGEMVLVTINEERHRGAEFAPSGKLKVAVYGDSFVAAEYTKLEDTFVFQLQSQLSERLSRPVQTLNAGVSAYGLDQVSLVMEADLRAAKPDLLVVCAYAGNDFGDLLRNKLFKLDAKGGLVRNTPALSTGLRREFAKAQAWSESHLLRAIRSATERWKPTGANKTRANPTPSDFFKTWLQRRTVEYEEFVLKEDSEVRNLFEDEYDADVSLMPDSDPARYRVRLMQRVLERLRDTARLHDVALMLVIIPAPFDVVRSYEPSPDPAQYPQYRRSGLCDQFQAMAEGLGIPCANLFEPFWQLDASTLYYSSGNDHWNSVGQKLAADVTSTRIVKEGLLK